MNFTPFPELKTERLLLRRLESSDDDVILFLGLDEAVTKYIVRPENKKTKTISDAVNRINELNIYIETNQSITWGITLKDESPIIGSICLWNFSEDEKTGEVGYELIPNCQNKGIMSEALRAIIDFGFNELNLQKMEAFTHDENENSIKMLVKNGFSLNENRKDQTNESNSIFEIENSNK